MVPKTRIAPARPGLITRSAYSARGSTNKSSNRKPHNGGRNLCIRNRNSTHNSSQSTTATANTISPRREHPLATERIHTRTSVVRLAPATRTQLPWQNQARCAGPRRRKKICDAVGRPRGAPRARRRRSQGPPKSRRPAPRRAKARRGRSPRGPLSAHIEKRPPRARRPALPQPRAAVLSAKAGLTAGFGMGPGDPRLCGRARGGRSPAALIFEPARNPSPGRPWRPHGGHGRRSRIALGALIEDAKSSGY